MRPGDVLLLWSRRHGKDKYVICVEPDDGLFLTINTDPPYADQAGVDLPSRRYRFLQHDSWIDTSKLLRIPPSYVIQQLDESPRRHKGRLDNAARARIKECVATHGILSRRYERLVHEKF